MLEPVNDPPIAHDVVFSVLEDGSIRGTLTGEDPEGERLTFSMVACPAKKGVANLLTQTSDDSHTFQYAPAAQLSGQDTFLFIVSDGQAEAAGLVRALHPLQHQPAHAGAAATRSEPPRPHLRAMLSQG